jgi:hypothetical protein
MIEKKIVKHECCGMPEWSEDQQKKMEALGLELEKTVLPITAQLEVKAAEIRQLVLADKPDEKAIDKKIDEIGALKLQIAKKRMANRLAVRALLTPEQRAGFDRQMLRGGIGCMDCMDEGPVPHQRGCMRRHRSIGPGGMGCPIAPPCKDKDEKDDDEE